MFWKPGGGIETESPRGTRGSWVEEVGFFAWASFYCPLVLFQDGHKVCTGGGWGLALTPGRGMHRHPGSLWRWEADQVDSAPAAAPEILEDRFTSCQILLVAHSPLLQFWGLAAGGEDSEGTVDIWGTSPPPSVWAQLLHLPPRRCRHQGGFHYRKSAPLVSCLRPLPGWLRISRGYQLHHWTPTSSSASFSSFLWRSPSQTGKENEGRRQEEGGRDIETEMDRRRIENSSKVMVWLWRRKVESQRKGRQVSVLNVKGAPRWSL